MAGHWIEFTKPFAMRESVHSPEMEFLIGAGMAEVVPPPTYDWVDALRERLRARGPTPPALVRARMAALAIEEEQFYCTWGDMQGIWARIFAIRDYFDWNVRE